MAVDPVSLAITAGLMAAQMALTATRKIEGPRLDDLNVSLAEYGTPIPRIWGTRRINPQIMWAEKLREKKKKSKTKGGKYTEYKYYGTWAVLLCDHEIDAVTRIWFDKRLIYQRTAAGPISAASALASFLGADGQSGDIKLTNGKNMRVYLGTETQEPDPRIESWCEDRYGADSCPAYRGSAYIVFEEIPLETVGNRIPQIAVEVVNSSSDSYPTDVRSTENSLQYVTIASDNPTQMVTANSSGYFEFWDLPTRTMMATANVSSNVEPYNFGISNGTVYAVTSDFPFPALVSFGPDGATTTHYSGVWPEIPGGVGAAGGQVYVLPFLSSVNVLMQAGGGAVTEVPLPFSPNQIFATVDGDVMCCGGKNLTNGFGIAPVGGGGTFITTSSTFPAYAMDNGDGFYFVLQNGKAYLVDKDTLTITAGPVTPGYTVDEFEKLAFVGVTPGQQSIWVGTHEISTQDLSTIQVIDYGDWSGLDDNVNEQVYDRFNDAIWGAPQFVTDEYQIRYLNRIAGNGVTLKTVVDDVSDWVGVTGHDSTALTQTVEGYSITQGQAKSMLSPLLDIHDVDARPHDFAVQFKNRGSSPSGTIATADLVRENGPRYTVTVQQDTDIPRRVTINFADKGKDQQTNTAIAQRPLDAVNSNREETIDLSTYVDTPDGAQQKADRYFRRAWNSRERTNATLTYQKIGLEPGDVTTLELDGSNRNVRVDKTTIGLNQISCEFVRDETSYAAINTATTGADMEGRDEEEIFVPGPVKGFIIDGPFAEDVDAATNPILYYLAGPYSGDFAGAVVAEGDSAGDYDEVIGGVDSSSDATWGVTTTALATANPNLWDRGNTLNVRIFNGTPTSVTEADINADPTLNLAAVGADGRWEYIQFTTATLQGDGTYTFSGFKRGRRGTENYRTMHSIGDAFVLLDNRFSDQRGVSDIGEDLTFKVQAPLRDVDAAPAIDIEYDAICLKPYAPCDLRAWIDTDGHIIWIRRTRIGGAWTGATIPVSEASESYEIDIYSGATFKRTLTSSTASVTYDAADMTADGTTSGFTAKVYQMSATVGRGFEASATFAF